jgi:hypothetical protein
MIEGRTCKHCGKPIDIYTRIDALYCSDACKVASYRERKESKEEEQESSNIEVTEEEIGGIHEHLYDIEKEIEQIKQQIATIGPVKRVRYGV